MHIYLLKVRYHKTICERREDHSDMEMNISEMGNIGTKGETRGDRDEWRGVRDVTEIEWTLGRKRCSRG